MRKKLLAMLLIMCMFLSTVPVTAFAEVEEEALDKEAVIEEGNGSENTEEDIITYSTDIASGTCGGCDWVIDAEGTLIISPTNGISGEIESNTAESPNNISFYPWETYKTQVKEIIFLDGVVFPEKCSYMFYNFVNLTDVVAQIWNTSNVKEMHGMFMGCENLLNIDVSKWDTSNVTSMSSLFGGCSNLISLDVSEWDTSNVTDMTAIFANCSNLISIDVSNWNTVNVFTTHGLFNGCEKLEYIDVSNWNVKNVVHMDRMFYGTQVKSLDLSKWQTDSLDDMWYMFYDCDGLTELDLSSWNVGKLTGLEYTFAECDNLVSLDLSGWKVGASLPSTNSNYIIMLDTFSNCKSLKNLNLTDWDVNNVYDISGIFSGCTQLESLDVSGWNFSGVEQGISGMFEGCTNLKELDVSEWNISGVRFLSSLFKNCSSLEKLDVSKWDTSEVYSFDEIFNGCSSLKELDLSGWHVGENTTWFYDAFTGCNSLNKIIIGENFNRSNLALPKNYIIMPGNYICSMIQVGEPAIYISCEHGVRTSEYCSVDCTHDLTCVCHPCGHEQKDSIRGNEVPATCKEAGSYEEVIYCSICEEEISRTTKTIDKLTTHTNAAPIRENEVPATTTQEGSYDEVVYCSVCKEEISREQKTIDKLVESNATKTDNRIDKIVVVERNTALTETNAPSLIIEGKNGEIAANEEFYLELDGAEWADWDNAITGATVTKLSNKEIYLKSTGGNIIVKLTGVKATGTEAAIIIDPNNSIVSAGAYTFARTTSATADVKISGAVEIPLDTKIAAINPILVTETLAGSIKPNEVIKLRLYGDFKFKDVDVIVSGTNEFGSAKVTQSYNEDFTELYITVDKSSSIASKLAISDIFIVPTSGVAVGDVANIVVSCGGVEKTTLEVGTAVAEIVTPSIGISNHIDRIVVVNKDTVLTDNSAPVLVIKDNTNSIKDGDQFYLELNGAEWAEWNNTITGATATKLSESLISVVADGGDISVNLTGVKVIGNEATIIVDANQSGVRSGTYTFAMASSASVLVNIGGIVEIPLNTNGTAIKDIILTEVVAGSIKPNEAIKLKLYNGYKFKDVVVNVFGNNEFASAEITQSYNEGFTELYITVDTSSTKASKLVISDIVIVPTNSVKVGVTADIVVSGAGLEETTIEVAKAVNNQSGDNSNSDDSTDSGSTSGGGGARPSEEHKAPDVIINKPNHGTKEDSNVIVSPVPNEKKDHLHEHLNKHNPEITPVGKGDYMFNIENKPNVDSLVNGGKSESSGYVEPDRITINLSYENLEDTSILTLVKYVENPDGTVDVIKLGGTFNKETGEFSAYMDGEGTYDVVNDPDIKKITFAIGDKNISTNDNVKTNDVAPILHEGITIVPLRVIAEILGATVGWEDTTKTVTMTLDGKTISLMVGNDPSNAMIIDSRTMVPLRYVGETFDAAVRWIHSTLSIEVIK